MYVNLILLGSCYQKWKFNLQLSADYFKFCLFLKLYISHTTTEHSSGRCVTKNKIIVLYEMPS